MRSICPQGIRQLQGRVGTGPGSPSSKLSARGSESGACSLPTSLPAQEGQPPSFLPRPWQQRAGSCVPRLGGGVGEGKYEQDWEGRRGTEMWEGCV